MPRLLSLLFLCSMLLFAACNSSTSEETAQKSASTTTTTKPLVGGPCQGCEAVLEYGDKVLTTIDTLPAFQETEPKMKVTGTIYQKDGRTPAAGVILYAYHTNRKGIYEAKEGAKGWAKTHGFIQGWIKTDQTGQYTFYTFRPAAYPNRAEPEHIHLTVKEPNRNEYYIESIQFLDDKLLTTEKQQQLRKRGGSGLTTPRLENGLLLVKRDIILGMNIPNYE
ncbi:MAG TPA: intradiol ring-cleavage dioxygenase [Microscillaceae bacterium]|nr:intradiol ring-cleavage dioxygenase [Microscillaceae bacterium]